MGFTKIILLQMSALILVYPMLLKAEKQEPRVSQVHHTVENIQATNKTKEAGIEYLSDLEQIAIRSAYLDLDVIVTSQERSDWVLDEQALQAMIPKVAEVLCQLSLRVKKGLESSLKEKVSLGQAKRYWESLSTPEKKNLSSKFKDLRHEERILQAFNYAQKYEKNCPYWLLVKENFMGIHRDGGRLQLIAETMGGLQLQYARQTMDIGGAAQGRLLGVYGISTSLGIAIGIEAGGASTFPKDATGKRSVKAQWTTGIPFLIRGWIGNLRSDLEVSPIARFSDGSYTDGQYGARFAVSFGVSPLRIFGILPHIMAWAGVEQFFDNDATSVLRAGTRIGFSL